MPPPLPSPASYVPAYAWPSPSPPCSSPRHAARAAPRRDPPERTVRACVLRHDGTTTFVISPAVIISRAASAPFGRRGSLELVVERSPGRSRGAIRTSHPVKFNLGARFARVKAANAPTAILRSSESAAKKPTGLFQMLILALHVGPSVVDHYEGRQLQRCTVHVYSRS